MKLVSILGTRPEIIKFSPLIPLLDKNFDHVLIHTGQHYDYEMDKIFFKELKLREPDYMLNVGSGSHAIQTAKMMMGIEEIVLKEKPDKIAVLADTNTPLAGALVASKCNIILAHIEAGCRSFNKNMPEEINRILVDHCSDILFAPDKTAYDNLLVEGVHESKIHLVGSTVIDACIRNKKIAENSQILRKLNLKSEEYVLLTTHRAENTNDVTTFRNILESMNHLAKKITIVFPIHPRTRKFIEMHRQKTSTDIMTISPIGYLDFLKLFENAKFVMTDSGGIQEEADVLGTPCIIMRNETEWTELVEAGKNILATTQKEKIIEIAEDLLSDKKTLEEMKKIKQIRKAGASEKITKLLAS